MKTYLFILMVALPLLSLLLNNFYKTRLISRILIILWVIPFFSFYWAGGYNPWLLITASLGLLLFGIGGITVLFEKNNRKPKSGAMVFSGGIVLVVFGLLTLFVGKL